MPRTTVGRSALFARFVELPDGPIIHTVFRNDMFMITYDIGDGKKMAVDVINGVILGVRIGKNDMIARKRAAAEGAAAPKARRRKAANTSGDPDDVEDVGDADDASESTTTFFTNENNAFKRRIFEMIIDFDTRSASLSADYYRPIYGVMESNNVSPVGWIGPYDKPNKDADIRRAHYLWMIYITKIRLAMLEQGEPDPVWINALPTVALIRTYLIATVTNPIVRDLIIDRKIDVIVGVDIEGNIDVDRIEYAYKAPWITFGDAPVLCMNYEFSEQTKSPLAAVWEAFRDEYWAGDFRQRVARYPTPENVGADDVQHAAALFRRVTACQTKKGLRPKNKITSPVPGTDNYKRYHDVMDNLGHIPPDARTVYYGTPPDIIQQAGGRRAQRDRIVGAAAAAAAEATAMDFNPSPAGSPRIDFGDVSAREVYEAPASPAADYADKSPASPGFDFDEFVAREAEDAPASRGFDIDDFLARETATPGSPTNYTQGRPRAAKKSDKSRNRRSKK